MSRTRTVLVVEADPALRETIELILLQKGYHVVTTGDGLRAVQLAEQSSIDLALVDLLVPGQSGFQITTDLKERYGERIKIVVTSGHVSDAHQDYAFAAGAEMFLPKPYTVAQLLDAVTSLCPPADIRRTARIG